MANHVPDKVKKLRHDQAMAAQREVAIGVARSFVGRRLTVLAERRATAKELAGAKVVSWEHGMLRGMEDPKEIAKGDIFIARGEADAPDIDGRAYVRGDLPAGDFAEVKL